MSARDEIARVIQMSCSTRMLPETAVHYANNLIALGCSMPRRITTAEGLDALPVGSVVKDEDGHAHLKYPRGWVRTGQEPYSTPEGILPAIVIHEASGE